MKPSNNIDINIFNNSSGIRIPVHLLIYNTHYSNKLTYEGVGSHQIILLILIVLYKHKRLNHMSLKAHSYLYYTYKLSRRINTYKSNINKQWYNYVDTIDIFLEIYQQYCFNKNTEYYITLEELIYVLMLSNNDYYKSFELAMEEFIKPLSERSLSIAKEMGFSVDIISMDQAEHHIWWCCEDCNRPFKDAVRRAYENLVYEERKKIKDKLFYTNRRKKLKIKKF